MSNKNSGAKQASRTSIIWLLIALLAVAGGTFAWFTFQTSTNVEPGTGGTVTNGDGNLLISNSESGPFSEKCDLILDSHGEYLKPVSTSTLNGFYQSAAQNIKKISILYSDVTSDIDNYTMHGRIYLKTTSGGTNVYLYINRMTFGDNVQAVAAMRLGLKITTNDGTYTYIFKLDDMMDTSSAEKFVTTPQENVVVQSISSGAANYVADNALNLKDYSSIGKSASDDAPTPGPNKLFTLKAGDIAKVEYIVYLEGCDVNCFNPVQNKDVAFALSFAGSSSK